MAPERADEMVFAVAKRTIRRINPLELGRRVNEKDPYDLLGLTPATTDEQVQDAYRRSIAAVHPDRVHSLGLPTDFLALATRRAAQLNNAYRKIRCAKGRGGWAGLSNQESTGNPFLLMAV
jgi:DnaJ-domain-containing protein 1